MYVKRETNEVADRLVKESPSLMKKHVNMKDFFFFFFFFSLFLNLLILIINNTKFIIFFFFFFFFLDIQVLS
jgi:hypothetical protein